MDFYFEAQDITAPDKKHSMLLSACGTETYKTLKNLVRPASLKDKSYNDLVTIMDTLNPPSSSIDTSYLLPAASLVSLLPPLSLIYSP